LLARILRPLFRMVTASWQMFAIGLLFGLGFDTATEISLFTVAAGQASGGLSFSTVMIFPALFAAGMTLVDTTDSVLMVGAYGWAFLNPIRKLWYNLTITAISVAVALLIGGIEALGLFADNLGLEGGFWGMIADLNQSLANFGYFVVGVFLISWVLSFAIYRWRGLERPLEPAFCDARNCAIESVQDHRLRER
jgi:high-affinity nickel-transport protein